MKYEFSLNGKPYVFSAPATWIAPNPNHNSFLPDLLADHMILKKRVAVLEQAVHDLLGPQVRLSYPTPEGFLDSMSAREHAVLIDVFSNPSVPLEACLTPAPDRNDGDRT